MIKYLYKRSIFPILLLFVISLFLTSCINDNTNSQSTPNILEVLQSSQGFDSFTSALGDTDLDSTVTGLGPYTVFVPTDSAFLKLPAGFIESLSNQELREVLSYHIIDGAINSSQEIATSLQGDDLYFDLPAQGSSRVNNTALLSATGASNGALYVINSVLLPDAYSNVARLISKRNQLSSLTDALSEARLTSALEDTSQEYTVFAPSDDALQNANLPQNQQDLSDALKYHVVPQKLLASYFTGDSLETLTGEKIGVEVSGSVVTINGQASVTQADIEGTNGVVHIIDGLLTPPGN